MLFSHSPDSFKFFMKFTPQGEFHRHQSSQAPRGASAMFYPSCQKQGYITRLSFEGSRVFVSKGQVLRQEVRSWGQVSAMWAEM